MANSIKIFVLSLGLVFILTATVFAQEQATVSPEITAAINLDENIQANDLGIKEPTILPDSSFYFLKSWARGIQNLLTINPVKKAELRMKIANEKLMETKEMIEKTKEPEKIKKAAESYQQEVKKIKEQVEKIKEKAAENPKVESFLDKFINQQTLHQKLLQRLETQVPTQAFEKIKEVREEHLEKFSQVMTLLGDKEKIPEKLERKEKIEEEKIKVQEKIEQKPIESVKPPIKPTACIQVITPAIGPGNVCKEFPTPCDVPAGWKKVDACPRPTAVPLPVPVSTPAPTQAPIPVPVKTSAPATSVACCSASGGCKLVNTKETCLGMSGKPMSISSCSPNPCPQQPPKVGPSRYPEGKCTAGEVINYKCADGTSFKWCTCDDLGWDCPMYKYAERLCPATKEITLEIGQPLPATCTLGEAINYKCPDGRISRTCICEKLGDTGTTAWECGLEPICSKPGPPVEMSVGLSGAVTSDLPVELETTPFGTVRITWFTSEPATSLVEYGPTTAYGFTAGPDYHGSTYQGVDIPNLQSNITYHFRIKIRDKDITPNNVVTEDYTFIIRKLPDLTIFPISVDHFNGDTPNKIHVKIENNGVATASKGFVIKVYVDDNLVGQGTYDSDLAAGTEGEKVFDYTFPGTKGYAIIKAAVDATNLVTELNEKNNETRHDISIYSPTTSQPAEPVKPSQ